MNHCPIHQRDFFEETCPECMGEAAAECSGLEDLKPFIEENAEKAMGLRDGEPCNHPGCLSHVSHPCEGCGRIGGRHGA